MIDPERTQAARRAAEAALVRVVHHYGETPEFVLLGGLIPELLCSTSSFRHAGTSDIDVQVDLELAAGAVNGRRLEYALRNAEFSPDSERVWRWACTDDGLRAVVKFELLCDLPTVRAGATIRFDEADHLGAANLRGTGVVVRDVETRRVIARIGGHSYVAEVKTAGVAGFLLAKAAAAHGRGKAKDYYDIAFVLLHGDAPIPVVIERARSIFGEDLRGSLSTALRELQANFGGPQDQGPSAYAEQFLADHPDADDAVARADAILAVRTFCDALIEG